MGYVKDILKLICRFLKHGLIFGPVIEWSDYSVSGRHFICKFFGSGNQMSGFKILTVQ
jgi:hypothetical protein